MGVLPAILHTGTQKAAALTDGFSLAQLGEVYVSAAMEWHDHGKADIELIIKDMQGELDSSDFHIFFLFRTYIIICKEPLMPILAQSEVLFSSLDIIS